MEKTDARTASIPLRLMMIHKITRHQSCQLGVACNGCWWPDLTVTYYQLYVIPTMFSLSLQSFLSVAFLTGDRIVQFVHMGCWKCTTMANTLAMLQITLSAIFGRCPILIKFNRNYIRYIINWPTPLLKIFSYFNIVFGQSIFWL